MKTIILFLCVCVALFACKTVKTTAKTTTTATTTNSTPTQVPVASVNTPPPPMHVTPPTQLEETAPITSPLLIGSWELDTLVADGKAIPMSTIPNKMTMQFTGTGLMIVKGSDQKDQFFTYNYKDSMISTLEKSTPMYVKTLNSRSLVVLMTTEGKEVRMVYKKK